MAIIRLNTRSGAATPVTISKTQKSALEPTFGLVGPEEITLRKGVELFVADGASATITLLLKGKPVGTVRGEVAEELSTLISRLSDYGSVEANADFTIDNTGSERLITAKVRLPKRPALQAQVDEVMASAKPISLPRVAATSPVTTPAPSEVLAEQTTESAPLAPATTVKAPAVKVPAVKVPARQKETVQPVAVELEQPKVTVSKPKSSSLTATTPVTSQSLKAPLESTPDDKTAEPKTKSAFLARKPARVTAITAVPSVAEASDAVPETAKQEKPVKAVKAPKEPRAVKVEAVETPAVLVETAKVEKSPRPIKPIKAEKPEKPAKKLPLKSAAVLEPVVTETELPAQKHLEESAPVAETTTTETSHASSEPQRTVLPAPQPMNSIPVFAFLTGVVAIIGSMAAMLAIPLALVAMGIGVYGYLKVPEGRVYSIIGAVLGLIGFIIALLFSIALTSN